MRNSTTWTGNRAKRNSELKKSWMKISINKIKHLMESIISRLDQAKERISKTKNKVKEILHLDRNKCKKSIITTASKTSVI
jgi:DNA relaxase NicK